MKEVLAAGGLKVLVLFIVGLGPEKLKKVLVADGVASSWVRCTGACWLDQEMGLLLLPVFVASYPLSLFFLRVISSVAYVPITLFLGLSKL